MIRAALLLTGCATLLLATVHAAGTTSTAPTGSTTTAAQPAAGVVLQTQGDAAQWTPLMKLEVTIHDSIEIVSIPVASLTAPKSIDGTGAMGNPWKVQLTPLQELTPGNTTPAFRIQSAPPAKPMDVATWPTAHNEWTLELRAQANKTPSRHAVVLEVDASACKPLPAKTPAPAAATNAPAAHR